MAHRGAVSCVTGNRAIIVTGGPDGRVTVWSRRSHDLLISFNDHTKPVVAVVLDCVNPEILYSVGQDRIVNTYSLRAARRLRLHSMPQPDAVACNFTAMVQLTAPTSERELVCATSDGRVFIYDPAVPDSIVGSVDVLALLVARGRAAQASGVTVVGEEVALLVAVRVEVALLDAVAVETALAVADALELEVDDDVAVEVAVWVEAAERVAVCDTAERVAVSLGVPVVSVRSWSKLRPFSGRSVMRRISKPSGVIASCSIRSCAEAS